MTADEGTADIQDFLEREGLLPTSAHVSLTRLSGGVSADIWRVVAGDVDLVVKRPLAKLRVAEDWQAPMQRSQSEADWLREVGKLVPGFCPGVLAYDRANSLLALEFLDPASHPVWKSLLMSGTIDSLVAKEVGDRLGAVHALSSSNPDLPKLFATDHLFEALRLEPYFRRASERNPQLVEPLTNVIEMTATTHSALVHGDVSPKNILVGPNGPVLLDAECAWWGDPAFDLAFCLNHLLLKSARPGAPVQPLLEAFSALATAYLARVTWEPEEDVDGRAACLLAALLLARVDGRSPVEYLEEPERAKVRTFAHLALTEPSPSVAEIKTRWSEHFR